MVKTKDKKKPERRPKGRKPKSRTVKGNPPKQSFTDIFTELFGSAAAAPEYEAIASFKKLKDDERVRKSRELIQTTIIDALSAPDARFPLAVAESESLLKGYATLDEQHRADIDRLIKDIKAYLGDGTRKRPFNALMLASPGAGKSHFIRQLAESMKHEGVQAVTFNMATMQSADDMAQPVDELRNLKVNDQYPLLFLDEFDSDPTRYSALLPLLWDGELQVGHRDLKLGKAVIVLAGSSPDLPKVMDQSAEMDLESDLGGKFSPTGKLIDLLSRVNGGVIDIPDLDLRSENRDRRVDKVCVAIALLRGRFGQDIAEIPRSLLRFIAQTTFRYGVRSIAHLIDVIDIDAFENKSLDRDKLGLPIESENALQKSSLRLHLLDKDQAFGIVNRWKQFSEDRILVGVRQSLFQNLVISSSDFPA